MKHIKQTIKITVLFFNVFAVVGLLSLIVPESKTAQYKRMKAENTAQDLKEWIEEDRFNGALSDEVADLYQEKITELEEYINEQSK